MYPIYFDSFTKEKRKWICTYDPMLFFPISSMQSDRDGFSAWCQQWNSISNLARGKYPLQASRPLGWPNQLVAHFWCTPKPFQWIFRGPQPTTTWFAAPFWKFSGDFWLVSIDEKKKTTGCSNDFDKLWIRCKCHLLYTTHSTHVRCYQQSGQCGFLSVRLQPLAGVFKCKWLMAVLTVLRMIDFFKKRNGILKDWRFINLSIDNKMFLF